MALDRVEGVAQAASAGTAARTSRSTSRERASISAVFIRG